MSNVMVVLSWEGDSLTFNAGNPSTDDGLYIAEEGIEGFYGTPDQKVTRTERLNGDGSHEVKEMDIHYAARIVKMHFLAFGRSRAQLLDFVQRIGGVAHRIVTFRVIDDGRDTFVRGTANFDVDPLYSDTYMEPQELTVVCDDPRRYGTESKQIELLPTSTGNGGLFFGDGGTGLQFPLTYGIDAAQAQNIQTLHNDGASVAYPVITAYGDFNRLRITCGAKTLEYSQPIGEVPLVLDSANGGSATVGGADVSHALTYRGFPEIQPGSDATFVLQSAGTGWVTVSVSDTYI